MTCISLEEQCPGPDVILFGKKTTQKNTQKKLQCMAPSNAITTWELKMQLYLYTAYCTRDRGGRCWGSAMQGGVGPHWVIEGYRGVNPNSIYA